MKKKAALLVMALVMGINLIGCGSENSSVKPAETADKEAEDGKAPQEEAVQGETAEQSEGGERASKIRLVLEGAESTSAQTIEAVFGEVLSDYEEKTGTQVEFVFVPDKDYRAWQTTQQAGGNMPEVYSTKLAWVWEDYTKGQSVDMSTYLEAESPYAPGKPWKDTFIQFQLDQTKEPTTQKYVSALRNLVAVRIVYNKAIFEEAGITKEPTTWTEFMEVCEKIKQIEKIPFAFAMQNNSQYASWFLTTLFGQLDESLRTQMDVNKDNMVSKNEFAKASNDGLIDYTQDPFKTGFSLMNDFSKYWNSDYNAVDVATAEQMWLMGDAAMVAVNSVDMLNYTQLEGFDFDYGLMPLPLVTEEVSELASGKCTMLGGAANESWAISSTTSGAELNSAVDLIQYLTSPEVIKILSERLYYIPVISDVSMPSGLEGFAMRDYEDIRRANYTGPATLNEFSSYITLSLQLYLAGELSQEEFAQNLNEEWKKGMENTMNSSGWTAENNYGITN